METRKIYIDEKNGSLCALDEFDNLLFTPLNQDGIQNLDFDNRSIVDEFDSENDVEETKRIKNLLNSKNL